MENPFSVVLDFTRFPMKELRSPDDLCPEGGANGCLSQTNSQNRELFRQLLDQLHGYACLLRCTRPGRNHDLVGLQAHDLLDRNLVVRLHLQCATQFAEVLGQVVGKRIVVVEQQNHFFPLTFPFLLLPDGCAVRSAPSSAFDLFNDSSNSPSAGEPATIPPPACTWATPFLMTIVRKAMHESRFPAKSRYRIPPAYIPRRVFSRSSMISIARTLGAPETVPAGKHSISAPKQSTPSPNFPRRLETRCITWE